MHKNTLFAIGLALLLAACGSMQGGMDSIGHSEKADAARESGDYDKAIAEYTEAIRLKPDAYWLYTNRGNTWRSKGEHDRAIADFTEAIRLDPRPVAPLMNRGSTYRDLRDFDRAIADYTQAQSLRYRPAFPVILQLRAEAWYLKGDLDKSLGDYNELIAYHTYNASIHSGRGMVYGAKKDYDSAIADFNEAIRLDPAYGRAYLNRGMAHLAKGDRAGAIADVNKAAEVNPKDTATMNRVAWWLATHPDDQFRDGKRAVELARQACELTHWTLPGYLDTLAAAYAETGDFAQAISLQEKALQSPGHAKFAGAGAQQRLQLYRAGKPYRGRPRSIDG